MRMLARVEYIATHVAIARRAAAEVKIKLGYPSTRNHKRRAHFMGAVMREVVGEANAGTDVLPAMAARVLPLQMQTSLRTPDLNSIEITILIAIAAWKN